MESLTHRAMIHGTTSTMQTLPSETNFLPHAQTLPSETKFLSHLPSSSWSSSGCGSATDMVTSLPPLTSDTELRKLLADERMRSEQHKNNYQALKSQHTRLQDELVNLQAELKSSIEQGKLVHEKYKALLEQVRTELVNKHTECEDLKTQVLTEGGAEVLKLQAMEEAESAHRRRLFEMSEQVELLRADHNKIKYEYTFLMAEYEHQRHQHQQIVDEMKLKHAAEVESLQKERERLAASRPPHQEDPDVQRTRVLQRDNTQLKVKVKSLVAELDEMRAQQQYSGHHADSATRQHNRQLAQHATNVNTLQTERESLKTQVTNLQRELASTTDTHTNLTAKIHELEKDKLVLKNTLDEISHQSKVDMTNLKMDMLRERGDLERERDKLFNDIEELKAQLDIAECSLDAQSEALVEKEREATRRVQDALQTEWSKFIQVEQEKMELEAKLQEVERRKIDEETSAQARRDAAEDRIKDAIAAKDDAERETLTIRVKLEQQESVLRELERERADNATVKARLHQLETELLAYRKHEGELLDQCNTLKTQLAQIQQELRAAHCAVEDGQRETTRAAAKHQDALDDEKTSMKREMDRHEDQITHLQKQLAINANEHKRKKRKYSLVVSKLKNELALTSAMLEEAQLERNALKSRSAISGEQQTAKRQLTSILRRHRDFRFLLLSSSPDDIPYTDIDNTSTNDQFPSSRTPDAFEVQAERELEQLKVRVEQLDGNQRQQMDQLKLVTAAHNDHPSLHPIHGIS